MVPAGAAAEGSDAGRSHAPEAADQGGGGHLCHAQDGGGASVWTNQTSAWLPPVPLAWSEKGAGGVGHDLSYAQHSEGTSPLLWIKTISKGGMLLRVMNTTAPLVHGQRSDAGDANPGSLISPAISNHRRVSHFNSQTDS